MEEAQRALMEAKELIDTKSFEKAQKLLKISIRLNASTEASRLLKDVENEMNCNHRKDSTPSFTQSGTQYERSSSWWTKVLSHVSAIEKKYISPDLRIYNRGLLCIIVGLIIVKYVFHKKIGFGGLPGDINISSQSVYFSFPIVSCMLVSFILNAVNKLLNRN